MTREEPKLLPDIRDFTTQFYVILRREFSEWLEWSFECDLGMLFAKWCLDLVIRDFASFKFKNRSLKSVSYFLIFVIRENEILISVNRYPLFFRFVNRARDPPLYDPLNTTVTLHQLVPNPNPEASKLTMKPPHLH